MGDKTVRMRYIFKEDYNPEYITGTYGGLTPAGDLVANFFFERMAIPREITYELADSGGLGEVRERNPDDFVMVRYIQNGIIMNKETAVFIRDWLNIQIAQMEEKDGHDIEGDQ